MQNNNTEQVLNDFLVTQKQTTSTYNTWSDECIHENLRNKFLNILKEEHDIAQEVFVEMHNRGFYPVKDGTAQEVDALKQKFC